MKLRNYLLKIFILLLVSSGYVMSQSYSPEKFSTAFNDYLVNRLVKIDFEVLNADKFSEKYKLTEFFLNSQPQNIYGFIGHQLERIKVKIDNAEQSKISSVKYTLTGKTNVNNSIADFTGDLKLTDIYEFKEPITKHGLIICKFDAVLKETGTTPHIGVFRGNYYLILSKVVDDVRFPKAIPQFIKSHTFAGYWQSNDTKMNLSVMWGENYMLEELEDFLHGITGLLPIDEKIIEKSWNTYLDAYSEDTPKDLKQKAIEAENSEWWK